MPDSSRLTDCSVLLSIEAGTQQLVVNSVKLCCNTYQSDASMWWDGCQVLVGHTMITLGVISLLHLDYLPSVLCCCCSSASDAACAGYTGNFAGHVGATLAFMAGLFNSPHASNYKASNVWDVIPSDVVANVVLACAAAVGQGAAADCIATPTRDGRAITDSTPCGGAERVAAAAFHTRAAAMSKQMAARRSFDVRAFSSALPEDAAADVDHPNDQQQDTGSKGSDSKHTLLIIHCGSSTTYPLTIMESWNWGVEVYGAWPSLKNLVMGSCAGPMPSDHEPNPQRAAYYMYLTGLKIWLAGKILR